MSHNRTTVCSTWMKNLKAYSSDLNSFKTDMNIEVDLLVVVFGWYSCLDNNIVLILMTLAK